MEEDQRWQAGLRMNVKRLEQELQQMKSILPDLATAPDRETAHRIALEVQESGFSEHSAAEFQRALRGEGGESHAGASRGHKQAASPITDSPNTVMGQPSSPLALWPAYSGFENELDTSRPTSSGVEIVGTCARDWQV